MDINLFFLIPYFERRVGICYSALVTRIQKFNQLICQTSACRSGTKAHRYDDEKTETNQGPEEIY